jgi:hypothetical protein
MISAKSFDRLTAVRARHLGIVKLVK